MNQETIAKIDKLVTKLNTSIVCWFKEELAKILNPLREPHPEKNCYFERQMRPGQEYRPLVDFMTGYKIICGKCKRDDCEHTKLMNSLVEHPGIKETISQLPNYIEEINKLPGDDYRKLVLGEWD